MNDYKQQLQIVERNVSTLKPATNNARVHSKKQVAQIAASMREFGFTNPLLIDDNLNIIAGHGRLEAARLLGLKTVPTIRITHLSHEQIRAYMIADNKLAENAGWDPDILAIEFQQLSEMDLTFDLDITGFALPEIDIFIQGMETVDSADDETLPLNTSNRHIPAVSEVGELWQLGGHRLYCGNALETESYQNLMGDDRAQMIFSDPPYNVPIAGNVSGLGQVKHDDFVMACGEMSEAEFIRFHETYMQHLKDFSVSGSLHYLCMDWRHIYEILSAGRKIYEDFKNLCVWNKDNGGMGSFYRSKHELVFIFKHGTAKHINNIELGRHGRNRTNVWDYPGATSVGKSDLSLHPTVKPVTMIADAIMDVTKRGDIVLDPFSGSGSTLLAAEKTGRQARCIELDPYYVDVTIERFQAQTGIKAMRHPDGKSYDILKEETVRIFDSEPGAARKPLTPNLIEENDYD